MHIIVALLAILGGAAFWWWRFKMIGEAASEVHDLAGRAWGKYKRKKFLRKVEDSPLAVIDDPATAAVILMYAILSEDGVTGPAGEEAIRREVTQNMGIADPTEIMTFAKWTASHAVDANSVILRYGKLWQDNLTSRERADLVAMIERLSSVADSGSLALLQKTRLSRLRQRLGLAV